ncbi:hypothetical protein BH10PLA2_BH10PLA2_16990 [soil metagenome]
MTSAFAFQNSPPVPQPVKSPTSSSRPIASRLANAAEARQRLGLIPAYEKIAGVEAIKIAILDYGFDGIESSKRYLPENVVVVENYDPAWIQRWKLGDPEFKKPFAPMNAHGRTMAEIVWAITGFLPQGPRFYLLNANGPTMLRRAVRYAIDAKVDIILFSNVFEGGGHGDGRGPINRIVAEALAADILWINAAGNYGGDVYNNRILIRPDGYVQLGKGTDPTALRFRNLLDENTITVTLTWNDYRDQEDAGTIKDLDLYIEDADGKRVGASEKKQVAGPAPTGAEESRNPRERVVLADLPAQPQRDYRIRVKAKQNNFKPQDEVRILVAGSRAGIIDRQSNQFVSGVQFLDASGSGEVYPPADNPLVLAVGDGDASSSVGPTTDRRIKPDVVIEDSRAYFTNGEVTAGASNAAAYFAGVVALMKAADPRLRTRHLLYFAHYGRALKPTSTAQSITTTTTKGTQVKVVEGTRIRRVWTTPTLQELRQQIQKDGN